MSKRRTLDKFMEKAIAKHGNKYDYRNVIYLGSKQNVIISCSIHGNFNQRPDLHLSGRGCPKCGYSNVGQFRKHSLESFINKAHKVHGSKYDYSLVNYINGTTKTTIICPEHGSFEQSPSSHLEGRGCSKCNKIGYSKTDWLNFCSKKEDADPKVYVIRCFNSNEEFIKIGLTSNSVSKRFLGKRCMPYSYEVINEIKGSPDFIFDKEKEFHLQFKEFKHIPKIYFIGYTECFNISILSMLK